jgi:peptidyl-tRNA hydrolase, PTH2 family
MTRGKAASQAGHAFQDSFLAASSDLTKAYIADGGTKIVLTVSGERELCDLFHKAKMAGLPCAIVVEKDHVMPPHFDGSEIVTAVGIGPVERSAAKPFTKGLPLMK